MDTGHVNTHIHTHTHCALKFLIVLMVLCLTQAHQQSVNRLRCFIKLLKLSLEDD